MIDFLLNIFNTMLSWRNFRDNRKKYRPDIRILKSQNNIKFEIFNKADMPLTLESIESKYSNFQLNPTNSNDIEKGSFTDKYAKMHNCKISLMPVDQYKSVHTASTANHPSKSTHIRLDNFEGTITFKDPKTEEVLILKFHSPVLSKFTVEILFSNLNTNDWNYELKY